MKLLFLGDFLYDYNDVQPDIQEIAKWIEENDYKVILNLEGPLNNSENPIKKRGKLLAQSKVTIDVLKELNVVGVCLANNHIMDYGEKALLETTEILKSHGIHYVGAGLNLSEALKPMIINHNNVEVIIQNFGWELEETVYATALHPGSAPRVEEVIFKNTQDLKKEYPSGTFINIYHWGFELNTLPMPLDVKLAHLSIDQGIHLVIGHHSHNIQAYENYKGRDIYYSLGNFYFSKDRDTFSQKKFPGDIVNLCDYGLAIVYDTEEKKVTKEFIIYYDKKIRKSRVLKMNNNILPNLTGVNVFNSNYEKQAKRGSININPILTLDQKANNKKTKKLYRTYFFINLMKSNYLGRKVYRTMNKVGKVLLK